LSLDFRPKHIANPQTDENKSNEANMTASQSNSSDKDVEDPIKLKEEEKPVKVEKLVKARNFLIFETFPQSKFLRVITVSAYLFSVSFAALMLSLYYIFIWSEFSQ
jgi:TRP-interacting helix